MSPEERAEKLCFEWGDDEHRSKADLVAAFRAAALEEREACARLVETAEESGLGAWRPGGSYALSPPLLAAAIRARGTP